MKNKSMHSNIPPNSWFKYIKYTDNILRNEKINPINLSNPFLHPIKPEYKVLEDLDYLVKGSNSNYCKLKLKFYVYFFKSLWDILEQIFFRKENNLRNQKKYYKKKYDAIFISHLNNTKRLEKDSDAYFGNVINKLAKEKKILLLLIPHCSFSDEEINKFILKSRNYDVSIFNKKLVSFKTKIKYIFEILKERKKFLDLAKGKNGINKNLLLMTANYFLSPGHISYIMSYLQLKEILKNVKSKSLVTTFEGHAREKLFYYAAHESKQDIKCIAFQHTLLFKYQHSITRSVGEIYNPDLILCAGEMAAKTLKQKLNNKKLIIKVLGSPEEEKNNLKINRMKKNIILFLPSGDLEESKYMTNFAIKFAKTNYKISVIIRYHPLMLNKFENEFKENFSNLNISCSSLEEDCNLAKWAVYSASTAILKAIKLGCMPIRLFCNLPTDFGDPLWQIESSEIKTISKPDHLLDIYLNSYRNYHDIDNLNLNKDLLKKLNRLRTHLNLKILKENI